MIDRLLIFIMKFDKQQEETIPTAYIKHDQVHPYRILDFVISSYLSWPAKYHIWATIDRYISMLFRVNYCIIDLPFIVFLSMWKYLFIHSHPIVAISFDLKSSQHNLRTNCLHPTPVAPSRITTQCITKIAFLRVQNQTFEEVIVPIPGIHVLQCRKINLGGAYYLL